MWTVHQPGSCEENWNGKKKSGKDKKKNFFEKKALAAELKKALPGDISDNKLDSKVMAMLAILES